jgi:hypothetical protein
MEFYPKAVYNERRAYFINEAGIFYEQRIPILIDNSAAQTINSEFYYGGQEFKWI